MTLDILAFGAHADDVELGCAGTLLKVKALGHRTGVIALTRGEAASRGSPEIRFREFDEAARILGLSIHKMLDIPDAEVELNRDNKLKIIREIRALKPRLVLAPYWITRHPDHETASHLVRQASYLAGLKKLDTGQEPHRPYRVLYYQARFEFNPSFIVDITDFQSQKVEVLKAYQSQFFSRNDADPEGEETLISRPDFLERIETRDRQYGTYIGVRYGEPFLLREAIKIHDPVEFFGPDCFFSIP